MINATKTTGVISSRSKASTPMLQKSILALTIGLAFAIDKLTAKKLIFTSLTTIDKSNTTADHLDDDKNAVLSFSLNTSTITSDEIEASLNKKQHVVNVLSQELPAVAENEENEITIDVLADDVIETSISSEQANIETADMNTESGSATTTETSIGAGGFSLSTIAAIIAGVGGLVVGTASSGGGGGTTPDINTDSKNNEEKIADDPNDDTQENPNDTEDCSEDVAIGCSEPKQNQHNDSISIGCGEGIVFSGSKQVSDFTLTDIEGNEHSLSTLINDKSVLVNFFSSGCSHCLEGLDYSKAINNITAQYDDVLILHIEMNEDTPQNQLDAGIDKFNFTSMHDGESQLVFNLSAAEIADLSAYTSISELDTCGWPAIYSINSRFDMIGIHRDNHTTEEIYNIIQSHRDPALELIVPHNDEFKFDSNSVVYKSMARQSSYEQNATASNWTLTDIDGTEHNLYDYLDNGSAVILEYFSLQNLDSQLYHQSGFLNDMAEDYDDVAVFMLEATMSDDPKTFASRTADNNAVIVDLSAAENSGFLANNAVYDYIFGDDSVGYYGLTEVPAVFFISEDKEVMKIASNELYSFSDHNAMYSELMQFNDHYDTLITQVEEDNISIFKNITISELTEAPKWTLIDINGDQISLDSLLDSGKIVLVEHFATWCGACKNFEQSGLLSDLAKNYSDEISVVMIEASSGSSSEELSNFLTEHNLESSQKIFIETETTAQDYGLEYYPTLHAINSEGQMINWSSVRGSFNDAEELYQELLNFEALTTTI